MIATKLVTLADRIERGARALYIFVLNRALKAAHKADRKVVRKYNKRVDQINSHRDALDKMETITHMEFDFNQAKTVDTLKAIRTRQSTVGVTS